MLSLTESWKGECRQSYISRRRSNASWAGSVCGSSGWAEEGRDDSLAAATAFAFAALFVFAVLDLEARRPLPLRLIVVALLFFLLVCDRCDDHLPSQRREGSRHVDIEFCADPVRVEKAILLRELAYALFRLEEI